MNGKKVIRRAMLLGFMVAGTAYAQQELGDANPLSGDAKAIKSGKSWFRNTCTPCHGGRADGMGDMGTGADLRKLTVGFKRYYDTVKNALFADGSVRTYSLRQEIEAGTLPAGATTIPVGPESPLADLRKLKIGFKGYYDTVKNGRKVQGRAQFMPSFSFLDDKTIFEIGAYLETLAIEGANWKEGVVNK